MGYIKSEFEEYLATNPEPKKLIAKGVAEGATFGGRICFRQEKGFKKLKKLKTKKLITEKQKVVLRDFGIKLANNTTCFDAMRKISSCIDKRKKQRAKVVIRKNEEV